MRISEAADKISAVLAEATGIDASWHWSIAFQAVLEAEQTTRTVKEAGLAGVNPMPPLPEHIIEELTS